ncbi:hypothetical protein [Kitasatospora sp. NBC_00315]|uniref:hypothetical protein n=1 Tax=Kitasatospora sp. NBC_00315 TaxID=2975963 RepID=UPI00324D9E52
MSTSRRSLLLSAAAAGGVALGTAAAGGAEDASAATTGGVDPSSTKIFAAPVSGNVNLDVSTAAVFVCTLAGNTTFTFQNWPAGAVTTEPTVIAVQDSTGQHGISFTGVSWLPAGALPAFQTEPNEVNVTGFFSTDNGTTVYGQGAPVDGARSDGAPADGGPSGFYGDGGDGAFVLDGTRTYAGVLGKSGSYYWLLRDLFASSVTVGSGVTLQLAGGATASYRLFCAGTLDNAGSVVTYVNTASSGRTAGSNLATGTLKPGLNPPSGGTGAGAAGTGGAGRPGLSAGSGGGSGARAGGAGGVSSLAAGYSLPQALPWAAMMAATGPNVTGGIDYFPGGAGGGAGAGDGTNAGGAGGPGGNPLFVAARKILNSGQIVAYGGGGGAGTGGDAGGGGGGQGGPVMVIHGGFTGNDPKSVGGPGGAKQGNGNPGGAGGAGWVVRLAN